MNKHVEVNQKLVVVLGMHRSGTSAITRALLTMGVSLGDRLMPPVDGNNDKGFWEDVDLVALNAEMLKACGREWFSLEPIQQIDVDFLCSRGYLLRAIELLRTKLACHGQFGFKDPRTAKLLPFWAKVFAAGKFDVYYLLALRNPLSVVRSLARRDKFDPELSYFLWLDHILACLAHSKGRPMIAVDYDQLMYAPESELGRVASWLGTSLDHAAIEEYCRHFLAKGLRHSQFSADDVYLDVAAPDLAKDVHGFLIEVQAARAAIDDAAETGRLRRWEEEWGRYRPLLRVTDKQHCEALHAQRVINENNLKAAERDAQIEERDAQIAERDAQIAERDAQIAERDAQIAERDAQIAERDAQIDECDQLVANRDERVTQMLNSTSWRAMAPMRYVSRQVRRARQIVRLLPAVVSRGGGFRGTARKAFRVLRREGLFGVRTRLQLVANLSTAPGVAGIERGLNDSHLNAFNVVPYYVDPRLDILVPASPLNISVAVHLHLFYPEMMFVIAERLANIPCSFDLYVSISQAALVDRITGELRELLPRAEQIVVEQVPNRGRDLAPMIVQFGQRLAKYSMVGHFHTKKSLHNEKLEKWCIELLDQLLGAPGATGGRLVHLFEILQSRAKIVYPEGRTEFLKDRSGWADNYELARQLLDSYTKLSINDFPVVEFPEGAMFWARSECLQELLHLPLTFDDFPPEPIPPDGTLAHALERLILILASPHEGQCVRLHRGDSIADFRAYETRQDYRESIMHHDVKVLAYYLPQFHPIPENDAWHGEGFTEWTKVRAANPLFKGHYQQHIPHPDLGYYLLDSPDTLRKQADLMHYAGVHGMVFYHYWFGGKLILEEPACMLLGAADIDMPFCFCWANENWTRRWDGNESEILLAQNYSTEDARAFIQYLIPFFQDRRYIRVDERPVLYVYRPSSIPDVRSYLDVWASECQAEGLKAPYVVAVLTRGATHPGDFGMDAGVERVLHDWTAGGVPEIKGGLTPYLPINGSVIAYNDVADYYSAQTTANDFTYFRSIIPMWDNTARYGSEAYVVHGSSPERFQEWLESLIQYSKQTLPADRRFILVNAWNEWAEGAHLEPDSRYGYSYLNAVGRALSGIPYADQFNQLLQPELHGICLHLSFPPHFRDWLADDPDLAHRFLYGLERSLIAARCNVTVDFDIVKLNLPAFPGSANEADYVLEFRRIAFFSPELIRQMLETALACRESVVIPNAYDGGRPLVNITRNGSVQTFDAHEAPMVLYPKMPEGRFKNFRMRTDAHCFVAYPNSMPVKALPIVTTIIRFHKTGDLDLLRNALGCLAAMHNCICVPMIAAQDISPEQTQALCSLLDDFAWHSGHPPQVYYYHSTNGHGDLRSKMLNESLMKVKTQYAAFLDYDDLVMWHAYEWLIDRLRETGKAVAFGRVYSTTFDGSTGQRLERSQVYEYGSSYEEFVQLNHAPLHSFLLDVTKLDLERVVYHEDQRYLEDYFLTLQLFTATNVDWDSLKLNRYIGDYIHSIDRSHTLAFADDNDRRALLSNPEYLLCEQRINNLRMALV